MNKKVIIYLILGFAVAYAIGYIYVKGMRTGMSVDEKESQTSIKMPSAEELKAKGYDDTEVKQIMASDSYKNGTGTW